MVPRLPVISGSKTLIDATDRSIEASRINFAPKRERDREREGEREGEREEERGRERKREEERGSSNGAPRCRSEYIDYKGGEKVLAFPARPSIANKPPQPPNHPTTYPPVSAVPA